MLDGRVEEGIRELVDLIKGSEEYRLYQEINTEVKKNPELKQQIDIFRKRNFEMNMNQSSEVDWLAEMERFEKEYAEFRKNSLVNDFLAKELAFCRLLQKVNYRIFGDLDFEVDFLE